MDKPVKILLISTGDTNGAYEYLFRLGKLFNSKGHQVKLLVKTKLKYDEFIVCYSSNRTVFDLIKKTIFKLKSFLQNIFIYRKNGFVDDYFFLSKNEKSQNIKPERVVEIIGFVPDFIYSGMTDNFINSKDLLSLQQLTQAKVFNIAVDMNHFTGGCHYAWDCDGYINGCSSKCPAVINNFLRKIPQQNFDLKIKNVNAGKFNILTGSGWTLKQAKDSKIYKNQNIFYNINSLIDVNIFNPLNRDIAKRIFNLSEEKFYILMGCQNSKDRRKGFEYLVESLKILSTKLNSTQFHKIEVLIVSRGFSKSYDEIPFAKRQIDYINDYRLLSLLYQASSVFVNSSIEDSGPLMVSESLACGTPVVGFDMGIVNNLVISNFNGYKAKLKDEVDLSTGIFKIFNLPNSDFKVYSNNAFQTIRNYSSLESAMNIFNQIHGC